MLIFFFRNKNVHKNVWLDVETSSSPWPSDKYFRGCQTTILKVARGFFFIPSFSGGWDIGKKKTLLENFLPYNDLTCQYQLIPNIPCRLSSYISEQKNSTFHLINCLNFSHSILLNAERRKKSDILRGNSRVWSMDFYKQK